MGRPTKLNAETTERLIEAVRLGATWEIAAAAAGVDVSTVHRWRAGEGELNRELCDRLQKSEADGALDALAAIRQAAQGGTWQAAAWLLERRYPAAYGRRTEVAVSTTVKPVSEDETRAMLSAMTTAADQPEDG